MGIETYSGSERKNIIRIPLYYHARPLEHSPYDIVRPKRDLDADFEGAYRWLEREIGFYPLFLAVGATEKDRRMTGYQNQWRKLLAQGKDFRHYRSKGDIDNKILFGFIDVATGIFMDFDYWHIVLNSSYNNYNVNKWAKKLIFRPTWNKDTWLECTSQKPHSVQCVVPELDLRQAEIIWVRNRKTQKQLENAGFQNVEIRRVAVDE